MKKRRIEVNPGKSQFMGHNGAHKDAQHSQERCQLKRISQECCARRNWLHVARTWREQGKKKSIYLLQCTRNYANMDNNRIYLLRKI